MTWDLEELGDDAVSLRREDGLVLSATRVDATPTGEAASPAASEWRFTVDDPAGERLADHGWEIVDDEHLWEVLDGFTYRFRRESGAESEAAAERDAGADGTGAGDGQTDTAETDESPKTGEEGDASDATGAGDGAADERDLTEPDDTESDTEAGPPDSSRPADETGRVTADAEDLGSAAGDEPVADEVAGDRADDPAVADGPAPDEPGTTAVPEDRSAAQSDAPRPQPSDSAQPAESVSERTSPTTTDAAGTDDDPPAVADETAASSDDTPAAPSTDPGPVDTSGDAEADTADPAETNDASETTDPAETNDASETTDPAETNDAGETAGEGPTPAADETADTAEPGTPAAGADRDDTSPAVDRDEASREANVEIREARPADAERLAAVYRSAYAENRELGFPASAESVTPAMVGAWIDEMGVIVATADDVVVGAARLEATAPDRVKVSRLGVHADWKGRGIGSKLLDAAESAVNAGNADTIWLTTPPAHPHLPTFYRERGYERTGEYPLDDREYDEIVMEKQLD